MTDDRRPLDRRTFLQGTGAVVVASAVAGCGSNGGGDGSGGGGGSVVSSEAKSRVDSRLTDVGNYDGSVEDATGQDEVVVDVGAQGNGGAFAFAPPAVAVSTGTTISWQWTGNGGGHNVVSNDDSDFDFSSGDTKVSGDPYEQSFDDTGVALYYCDPHRGVGMKGAVVVVE